MKASTVLLMLSVFLLFSAVSAIALEIPESYADDIRNIEFFPNGAKFEFHVTPQDNGKFTAVLPGAFDPSSVRLLNPKDVYGNIMVTRRTRTRWTPGHLAQLKAQQEEQAEKVSGLEARRESLEQTLKLLAESVPDKANPAAIITYIRDAEEMRHNTEKELAALKATIAQEREKLNMYASELNAKRPAGDDSYITVTGEAGGTVMLEAFTSAASWRPKYVLNLNTIGDHVEVYMYVIASQKTGLNYEGDMTLHTKRPDEAVTTPSLDPLKVAIKPKEETIASTSLISIKRTNRMYKSAVTADEDAVELEEEEEFADIPQTESRPAVRESLSDRTLDIDGEIPGDGTEREFEVRMSDLNLDCKTVIVLIPELRNDAWIIASMDEGNEHLIPGEADLRVDNHSSGKIYIEEYGTGQKIIPFGYAEQITAKKERLADKTGVSWFSGVFTSGYKIEITNGTKDEQTVTVRDRLPVPTDDKIKLDVKSIEPKQKERDAENRLTWELTIPAGATVPITVDYSLSYPSGEELQYK